MVDHGWQGVAPLAMLLGELAAGLGDRPYFLSIEGLDSRRGVADQSGRLQSALAVLRELLPASATASATASARG